MRSEIAPAKALQLLELASYQEGSVVSRTLLDRRTCTVTLFAFSEGQGLSEHTAPYDALLSDLEGEAEVTISGNPNQLKQGDLILMPAGQTHSVRAKTNFKMLLTMIRSEARQ
ncbi:MAG: cupin domain-containing protein [Nitrososphaerota archaeon]|nr:cupin domain-containing protein [Nitrososphaerota archaeon]